MCAEVGKARNDGKKKKKKDNRVVSSGHFYGISILVKVTYKTMRDTLVRR